jgi:hypothetical protein
MEMKSEKLYVDHLYIRKGEVEVGEWNVKRYFTEVIKKKGKEGKL